MHRIKTFRLFNGLMDQLHAANPETVLRNLLNNCVPERLSLPRPV